MKWFAGADHAGYLLKNQLVAMLRALGDEVEDLGTNEDKSVDYPTYGEAVGKAVTANPGSRGLVVCGSGIGISIAANRHPACRCALVSEGLSARLARQHNDSNVVAMGARLIGIEAARDIVDQFLATPFGGGRHQRRVDKLGHPHFARENA